MASSPGTWTVVCFETDNAVQAVPTKWINGDNCLWPVLPLEKLNNALKHCDYNSCWPSHKVRIFRNSTYDDYSVARTKAAKAEYSSDLNSEPEMKRPRKKRILTSSSESEDEIIKKKKPQRKGINLPTPPMWNTPTVLVDTDAVTNKDVANTNDSMETPIAVPIFRETNIKETDVSAVKHDCKCNPKILYNIQSLLIEVNSKLDKLQSGNSQQSALEGPSVQNVLEKSSIELPMDSEEKIENMEQFLASIENYKSLVLYFAKMGGINVYDFVKRCLGPVMSDHTAMTYSFIGRKGKKNFSSLKLSKAVIESAERSGLPKTNKETENAIAMWLRKAKERFTKRA